MRCACPFVATLLLIAAPAVSQTNRNAFQRGYQHQSGYVRIFAAPVRGAEDLNRLRHAVAGFGREVTVSMAPDRGADVALISTAGPGPRPSEPLRRAVTAAGFRIRAMEAGSAASAGMEASSSGAARETAGARDAAAHSMRSSATSSQRQEGSAGSGGDGPAPPTSRDPNPEASALERSVWLAAPVRNNAEAARLRLALLRLPAVREVLISPVARRPGVAHVTLVTGGRVRGDAVAAVGRELGLVIRPAEGTAASR